MQALLKSVIDWLPAEDINIGHGLRKLHYKWTALFLAVSSLLLTSKMYFGTPIVCETKGVPKEIINLYCWFYGTQYSREHVHAVDRRFLKVYQFSFIVLLLQAMCFRIPQFIWIHFENKRCKSLIMDLNNIVLDQEAKNNSIEVLIQYFQNKLGKHRKYFFWFFFTEFLHFFNIILQIGLTELFLGNNFINYIHIFSQYAEANYSDNPIFPKKTNCTYKPIDNDPEKVVQCVLPLNGFNEVIYLLLYFWFFIVAAISLIGTVLSVMLMISSRLRLRMMTSFMDGVDPLDVTIVFRKCKLGDWLLLCLLARNMAKNALADFMHKFALNLVE